MPSYDYRCQECRVAFTVERSMNDPTDTNCAECGSANVSRIWNMILRSSGSTPDVGQNSKSGGSKSSSGGGCGSCSTHSCHSC